MRQPSRPLGVLGYVVVAVAAATLAATAAPAQTRDTPPPRLPVAPAAPIARDRPPVPKTGTAVIGGRVVDAVTGRAIARARIRLSGPAMQQGPILSGDDGAFEFGALPQGPFNLMVDRPGYSFAQYPDRSRSLRASSQPFELRDGQRVDDVVIRLFRSGAIAGRVVDVHGEPVENANITALFVPRGGRPQQRGNGQTNDLGEFRLWRLEPGRYLLRARAMNNYGNESGKALPQPVPVFYPNATTIDQAQVIVLNRGESATGIDIMLPEATPTVVSGIVMATDGQPLNGGSLSYRTAAATEYGGSDGGTGIRPDGSFRLQMPPGEYIFEVRSQPNRTAMPNQIYRPETELYGSTRVTVAGEAVEGVIIPVGTGATATGRIIFEGKTPPPTVIPPQVRGPLYNPDGLGCRPGMVTIAPDWSFKAEGLGGACAAQPQGIFGRWTLKAVMVGGDNLMDKTVMFQPGDTYANVRIIVTDLRPTVEFRVSDDTGELSREFVVLVFPADKARWNDQIGRHVRTFAMSLGPEGPPGAVPAGSVSAANVSLRGGSRPGIARMSPLAVGEYYAVAVDDIEREDLQDAGLLEKLVPSGVRFTVSAETPLEVPLRRVQLSSVVR
jgi:hypothetical protein